MENVIIVFIFLIAITYKYVKTILDEKAKNKASKRV